MTAHKPTISYQNGRYTVLAQIGSGGIADIWSVLDNKLETEKAMKVMTLTAPEGPLQAVQNTPHAGTLRFEREAKLMSRFNHPNILTVHDYFATEQNLFIIMEKCLGSLDGWVQHNGPMPVGLAIRVMIETLKGLEYAHQREIIHRDIKPHNILIAESGTIKLADFGLAHDTYASDIYTKTNAIMGSIQFMSPEQRVDAKRVDQRSDLYAVAMTLIWLIEGETVGDLYVEEVLDDLRTRHSTALIDVIERAGQRNPAQRYESARAMREALSSVPISETVEENLLFDIKLQEVKLTDLNF